MSFGKKMWKFPKAYAILINTLCKSFYLEVMFMEYIEKRLEGDIKYSGVIVKVRLDKAELINGDIVKREVVEHPGGVTVLPVDEDGNCYMVRQFRYPFQRMMLEARLRRARAVGGDWLLRRRDDISRRVLHFARLFY